MDNEPNPSISSGMTPAPMPVPEVNQLAARVAALENRLPANSWLFGNSFFRRVFAIWGHYFVAQLIIAIVLAVLFFTCGLLFAGMFAGLNQR